MEFYFSKILNRKKVLSKMCHCELLPINDTANPSQRIANITSYKLYWGKMLTSYMVTSFIVNGNIVVGTS